MPPPASLTCMKPDCSAGGGVSLTPPLPPACCASLLRSSEGVRSRPADPIGWLAGLSEEAVRGVTCPESTSGKTLNSIHGLTWAQNAGTQHWFCRTYGAA